MDIWGPITITYVDGHRYFLTVVNDFSRHTWIFLLKTKSEVQGSIKSYITLVETQFSTTVKCIRSDQGPEFNLHQFYSLKGIEHQMSCVETPQQNGVVERKHKHILNITRAPIFQNNLSKLFWNFVVSHVVFLLNKLPNKVLHNKSPYDILYDTSPDLIFIKVFGCEAFASTLTHNRTKLDPWARQSIYLGHRRGIKGSLHYDLYTKEVFLSRNVYFNENSFSFKHIINHTNSENFVMSLISFSLDPPCWRSHID